ncbi:MAG: carboxypeptidase regulatory-like domain-containing protein [Planctomycetes bacterium]|nr:carboxypeptidase regulatory-like domain-containing protein [Planctomycetota bacterium]
MYRAQVLPGSYRVELSSPEGRLASANVEVPGPPAELCLDGFVGSLRIVAMPVQPREPFYLQLSPSRVGESRAPRMLGGFERPSWACPSPFEWDGSNLIVPLILPGTYEVFLRRESGAVRRLGRATLVAGQLTELVPEADSRCEVRGRVVDEEGKPIVGVSVAMTLNAFEHGARTRKRRELVSGRDGEFRFTDLCAGGWTLFPLLAGPDGADARELELSSAEPKDVLVVLRQPGSLAVDVRWQGGPVEKSAVSVVRVPRDTGGESARGVWKGDGRFAFGAMHPGRYEITVFVASVTESGVAGQSKYVDVQPRSDTTVEFDFDDAGRRVRITRGGKPFRDWNGGIAYGLEGKCWLDVIDVESGLYRAQLGAGPAVLMVVAPDDLPAVDAGSVRAPLFVGFVGSTQSGGAELDVELSGTDVVLTTRDPGAILPHATLSSIGPFSAGWDNGDRWPLAYVDEAPNRRRFLALPPGARIAFESRSHAGASLRSDFDVPSGDEVEVVWPLER